MPIEKEIDVAQFHRKAQLLFLMGFPEAAKKYEEVSKKGIMTEQFILDVSPEEFDAAGSKFATPGLHLAEMGMPEWENPGQSIRFPYIVIEESADNGKEGKLVAGVSKAAAWKLKEILDAVGVARTATPNGKTTFDANACVGRQFKVLYTEQVDTRSPEEGGKGTRYTKAEKAYPITATQESLGI